MFGISLVLGALASIGSAISSAVTSICAGGGLAAAVAKVVGTIKTAVTSINLTKVLSVVSQVISTIGQIFGVLKPNENASDLGEKALQAEEDGSIKPENYRTHAEYLEALRNYEINPDKLHSEVDRSIAGTLLINKALPQLELPTLTAMMIAGDPKFPDYLRSRLPIMAELAKDQKIKLGLAMADFYLNDKKDPSLNRFFYNIEKTLDPSLSPAQIIANLNEGKNLAKNEGNNPDQEK